MRGAAHTWRLVVTTMIAVVGLIQPGATFARRPHHHLSRPVHQVTYGGTGYYTAASGDRIHGPVRADSRPVGATARCRDASWSFSETHRGTCSHHGGVAAWL